MGIIAFLEVTGATSFSARLERPKRKQEEAVFLNHHPYFCLLDQQQESPIFIATTKNHRLITKEDRGHLYPLL